MTRVSYKELLDRITVLSLCALIFALPFSKSAIEICFTIALVSWGLKKASFHNIKPIFTPLDLAIALFVLAGLLSVCFSVSTILSLKGFFFKLLEGVALYFIVAQTVNSKGRLNLILTSMLLSMAFIGANGIFQLIAGTDFVRNYRILRYYDAHGMRMRSSFAGPNGFGGWLTVMIPLAMGIVASDKKQLPKMIKKSAAWILAAVLIICLVQTRSKGAWMGFISAVIFFMMFRSKRFFLIISALILITAFAVVPHFIDIHTLFNKDFIFSTKDRLVSFMLERDIIRTNLWREALLIIKDFPVFGCGLNTYSFVAPRYKSDAFVAGIYPHNSYLQMAAETGITGLTCFVLVLAGLFITSLKNMRRAKNGFHGNILLGLLAGLFGFLVHSFFDVHFYAIQLVSLMWFIMGLIIAVQKIALKEEDV